MKGTIIFLIAVASFIAVIIGAGWVEREQAARSLVRSAKTERSRTRYVFEDVDLGDMPFIPPSARVRDMAQREAM